MARRRGSLRIVAGELRGRTLPIPPAVRPTTDRVRAAIFDALQEVPPTRVLDCFAGSGGMGFEALSRGAEFATFVERGARAAAIIRASAREFDLKDACTIIAADVMAADLALHGPFGLVLADPPYAFDAWERFLRLITRPDVLIPEARLVAEYSGRRPTPPPPPGWSIWKTRRHGDAAFTIYCPDPDQPA